MHSIVFPAFFCENQNGKGKFNERWKFLPDPPAAPMRTREISAGLSAEASPGPGPGLFPSRSTSAHLSRNTLCCRPARASASLLLVRQRAVPASTAPVLKQNAVTRTLGRSPQTVSEGSHGVKRSQIPSTAPTSPGLAEELTLVSSLWQHQPPFPCLLLMEMGRG